jgi:Glycosyl hydrolase family 26
MGHTRLRNVATRAAAVVIVGGMAAAGGLVGSGIEAGAATAPVADIRQTLGFYPGFGNADELRSLEQELGFNVSVVVQFGDRSSPDGFSGSVIGQLGRLSGWIAERNPLYSVAIPLAFGQADARSDAGRLEVTANLQRTAAGEYDEVYQAAAYRLVDAGLEDAVLRIGHEFDAVWYPWSAQASCEGYAAAFRHVVDVVRQVSPAFRIEWTGGLRRFAESAECAYPGDEYVDIVGMTVFDKGGPIAEFSRETGTWRNPEATWASQFVPRLQFHHDFAVAHGKPVSYPEWGLVATDAGAYGGDNPTFIRSMAAWLRSLPATGPGSLVYHSYFIGRTDYDVRLHEQSRLAFFEEFGAAS